MADSLLRKGDSTRARFALTDVADVVLYSEHVIVKCPSKHIAAD